VGTHSGSAATAGSEQLEKQSRECSLDASEHDGVHVSNEVLPASVQRPTHAAAKSSLDIFGTVQVGRQADSVAREGSEHVPVVQLACELFEASLHVETQSSTRVCVGSEHVETHPSTRVWVGSEHSEAH
jgi:hypothetical protein